MPRTAKGALLVLACLAATVPAILFVSGALPYRVYVVHTGSMSPTIPSRSAVVVREAQYRLGQVITYRTPSGVVTHRLIKRNADGTLGTKGDANRTADPSSIRPSDVIGGVIAAPRMAGYWLVYFKNPAGLGSLFLAVICAWLLYSLPADVARLKRTQRARPETVATLAPICPPMERKPRRTLPSAAQATVREEDHVTFRCSRCGATFRTGEALRAHFADYSRSNDQSPSQRSMGLAIPTEYLAQSLWQKAT